MKENDYQKKLKDKLLNVFPGCYIMKNDPSSKRGIPDLTILYRDKWAVLEVKQNEKASKRPNQERHIDILNNMSYASFICPENEEEVFNELERTFKS